MATDYSESSGLRAVFFVWRMSGSAFLYFLIIVVLTYIVGFRVDVSQPRAMWYSQMFDPAALIQDAIHLLTSIRR